MSLFVRNTGSTPIVLSGLPVTVPANERMNVDSELRGLTKIEYGALETQRSTSLLRYTWSDGEAEFDILPVQDAGDLNNDVAQIRTNRQRRQNKLLGTDTNFYDESRLNARVMSQSTFLAEWLIGVQAGDVINVSLQLCNPKGTWCKNSVDNLYCVQWRLLDAIDGTLTTVAPDGGIAEGTNGKIWINNGDLDGLLCATSIGQIDLDITHAAGVKDFFMAVTMSDGTVAISPEINFT